MGANASEWIKQIKVNAPPEAQTAAEWVNALFSSGEQRYVSGDAYNLTTIVKGATRIADFKSIWERYGNERTDEEIINDTQAAQIPAHLEQGPYYVSKAENIESKYKRPERLGRLLDEKEYYQQHQQQMEQNLLQIQQEGRDTAHGVVTLQFSLPIKVVDGQGRTWAGMREEP